MPDKISSKDRALIDAAIKAGKITTIPKGQSGIPLDGMTIRESQNHIMSRYILGRKRAGEASRRRIKYLLSLGLEIEEIAKQMGLAKAIIKYHISKMDETRQLDNESTT